MPLNVSCPWSHRGLVAAAYRKNAMIAWKLNRRHRGSRENDDWRRVAAKIAATLPKATRATTTCLRLLQGNLRLKRFDSKSHPQDVDRRQTIRENGASRTEAKNQTGHEDTMARTSGPAGDWNDAIGRRIDRLTESASPLSSGTSVADRTTLAEGAILKDPIAMNTLSNEQKDAKDQIRAVTVVVVPLLALNAIGRKTPMMKDVDGATGLTMRKSNGR
jgi:hypothetical protein